MSADPLERARSAVTQDEECAVLRAAVCHFIADAGQRLPLIDIIVAVRSGRAPRPVLLGVVAALVPEGAGFMVDGPNDPMWRAEYDTEESYGPTPALALLIAILEATHE